ncbi:serine/threonine-protein kinase 31 isoform X1, partial [Arapaima gigas]
VELVGVTHVVDPITFWAQKVSDDQAVQRMTGVLCQMCPAAPRVAGSPVPYKVYAALFSQDGCWYRCTVQQRSGEKFQVLYVDYGNTELIARSSLVELPEELHTDSLAQRYRFWGFRLSSKEESQHFLQGKLFLHNLICGKKLRIEKKSVRSDGVILATAHLGDLDIGEEVLRMKFAEFGVPEDAEKPCPARLQESPALWTQRERWSSVGQTAKLRPVSPEQKPQSLKEKSTTTTLQPAHLLRKNLDKELVEENMRLKVERSTQEQSTQRLERELREARAELQRVKEAVLKDAREMEKLKEEKTVLQQNTENLFAQLGEVVLKLQVMKQQTDTRVEDADKRLETAVDDQLCALAEKVEAVRALREDSPCSTLGDRLLEAINVVTNNCIPTPTATEELDAAWKEYDLMQNAVKACQVREELDDLIGKRNGVRKVLAAAVDAYVQEVDGLPVSERMDTLEEVGASLATVFGSFSMEDVGDEAFEQFCQWKRQRQLETWSVREATDKALQSLCSWFENMAKFLNVSCKTSVSLSDVTTSVGGLVQKADWNLRKELNVSLAEQNNQDIMIVSSAFHKVMQEIQKEQNLLCSIQEKYLLNKQFREEVLRWQDSVPKADELFAIKKRIKNLRSQLRWRMAEESSLQEAEEQDVVEIQRKKEQIAETRDALFQEITNEKEEYGKLSVLANGAFPELPLLYPEAELLSYMGSDGLVVKSLDRDLFHTEPLRELSARRPLVCTKFQGQKVVLKGYSVDEEAEVRMLRRATQFYRASASGDQAGLLHLLALFFGKSDPLVYVMVPYFANSALRIVQKSSPLSAAETVSVMRGVALGLQTLHGLDITHGSLHPNNVFAVNREQGVVGDFDFSRTPEQQAADPRMVAGSLSLLAPEVCQGQAPSPASDMYAFGGLLLWVHFPEFSFRLKTDRLTPDTSKLKLDPKLHALLSKLLTCSGRLTACEVLSDDYFL